MSCGARRGNLAGQEYRNYVRLFHFAVDRVLAKHPKMQEEVYQMTEPLIKLPSVIENELRAKIVDREAEIADQKRKLADKDAEIQRLQELVYQLSHE